MIIKPHFLRKGDKVAVVAPSSATNLNSVYNAQKRISGLGLEPVMYPTCFTSYGHLAASDEERARDINGAFSDDKIKGIFCLRGGYGAMRILNLLDYDMIRNNPKIFIGFSDITALHVAFNQICRMVTFHGPMATSNFGKVMDGYVDYEKYTYESLIINLFTDVIPGRYENPDCEELQALVGGKAEGELIGGNLSLLSSALGSPYELDSRGKIIFIEEIGEPVYKIDRMLTSLALAGKFDDCSGIIIGTCTKCTRDKKDYEGGFDLPLEEVLANTLIRFNKPVITNFQAGHIFPQPTMAFGTHVKIDGDNKEIIFTESGNL